MNDLDSPDITRGDTLGIFAQTALAVDMFDAAREMTANVAIPFPRDAFRDVILCGMGGSGIAGDLLVNAYWQRLRKPTRAFRGYMLPAWAGESTLVVASSYSGSTEETLTCMMDAVDRTCPVMAITTGSKLRDHYVPQNIPVFDVPPSPMPRAALVQMLTTLALSLDRLGVIELHPGELEDARDTLEAAIDRYGPQRPESENPAKQIARKIQGTIPLIWGGEMTSSIAYRWKCQINENANLPSFWADIPEHNHNEIVGIEGHGRADLRASVVMLRDPRQHRQVERRFEALTKLIDGRIAPVIDVVASGQGTLGRIFDLVLLGDYVSLYLAVLDDVDPGPIEMIDRLKATLAEGLYGRLAIGR